MTGRRSNNSAILPLPLSASPLPPVLLPKCPRCTEIRGETIRCDDGVVAYVFCLSGAAHLPVRGNVFTKYFNYLIVKSARSSSCRSKTRASNCRARRYRLYSAGLLFTGRGCITRSKVSRTRATFIHAIVEIFY